MIDQRLLDAYLDYSGERARDGILECDAPSDGQTVEAWLVEKLRAAGRWPEGGSAVRRQGWKVTERREHSFDVESEDQFWRGFVKWDGCVHLWERTGILIRPDGSDEPWSEHTCKDGESCCDYYHICDLDDLIARLAALRDMAKRHFGDDWK